MPLTTYPVGTQILKIPVTIDIPAVNTPFNPDAINPSITYTFNGMKALEAYGFHRSDFDKAQPPYPTSSSTYRNEGDFYLTGRHIVQRTEAGTEGFFLETPETYTRGPSGLYSVQVSSSQWVSPADMDPYYTQGTDVVTGSEIRWIVHAPYGATITQVGILINPAGSHVGVPATMPSFKLYRVVPTTGVYQSIAAAATSDATSLPHYEDSHLISSAVFSQLVQPGEVFVFAFRGEYGTNALPGLRVYQPWIKFTRTRIGEE